MLCILGEEVVFGGMAMRGYLLSVTEMKEAGACIAAIFRFFARQSQPHEHWSSVSHYAKGEKPCLLLT
jgi:hypothetical protein